MENPYQEFIMENPYQEAKDLRASKWMLKNQGKAMLFSFIFTSIFIIFPWLGKFYIESDLTRYIVSGFGLMINILSTFVHPYYTWKSNFKKFEMWEKYYNKN